ncbi:MAG: Fe-S protein assembly chaperone HscA [Alphaproteobacteria bacterium]|nr:Fe-S protein assembly chaperone HscA [Alphaproteobacteria bacterium]
MNLINIEEPSKSISSQKCLGIDFGTTNSVCSIKIKDKIIFIEDKKKKSLIPSIVNFNEKIRVGNEAEISKNIEDCVFSVKRNFTENPDEKIIINSKKDVKSSVEIAKEVFSYLKNICDDFLNEQISDCIITVPAYYDERARSGIMRSALMAGFNVRRLINEPTAAAFAYGLDKKKRGKFLVYDLGGGTFDVSLLNLKDNLFKVIGTSGDSKLGGDDFDELLLDHIISENFTITKNELSNHELTYLLKECKLIKEKSQSDDNFISEISINGKKKKIKIKAKMIEKILDKIITKTILIADQLLKDCEIDLDEIDGFILVGGSTKLKMIPKKIKEYFKKNIYNDLDPDRVVSYGAALHGHELLNGSNNLLLDVTPLSLGIETLGGLMEKIIPRNSNIPIVKEQTFTTNENGQTSIKIKIIQGERETSDKNTLLGEFVLSNIEPKPAGIPRIKVRFSLDVDGILFVSAIDESTGKETNLVIKTSHDLSVEEMKKIVESSIENAKDDMDARLLIESKMKASRLINEIENVKDKIESLCSKKDIENINKTSNMLKMELKTNNKDKIENLVEILNEKTKDFAQKLIDKNFKSFVGKNLDTLE